ncbi:expansin EXLX1 family cellulose-binding protein [Micromonospora marina]|uniref:Peptidoglycan-binding domain-containing protein, expansin n=1 Tax=Micromonospora marina TaxID=307120 RepID=A0A1C4XYJ5_9ACTN|nr:expansin EXLX1 family cellulose-binding protein [Micromonospora marina]SCF13554.1 Peptidoglycan-binding domain-containing protein, expansin [Micromonospora marina]
MTDGTAPIPPTSGDAPGPATPDGRRQVATRRRRLAAAGLVTVAAAVAVTLAVRGGAAPACAAPPPRAAVAALPSVAAALPPGAAMPVAAAPPVGGATRSGKATFYDSEGAGGNCSRPAAPADRMYVALGPDEYASGASCGGFLDVTGPRGTVRVLVMDQCPECAPGHLDLSAEAFARIADPVQGVVKVSYRAVVNPKLPGPLTFRMKEGSSQWWFAVLVGDHGNPLRSVEVRRDGSWRTAQRQDYNYWLIGSGAGPGPYEIRVTDVYGHRATATGIRMLPGQVQRSKTRMYGADPATAGSTPKKPIPTPRTPAPSPSTRTTSPAPAAAPVDPVVQAAAAPPTPPPCS